MNRENKDKLLSYEEFVEAVTAEFKSYLPEPYCNWEVRRDVVYKVNRELDSITVLPPHNEEPVASPNFYLNDYYRLMLEGSSLEKILVLMAELFVKIDRPTELETSNFNLNRYRDHIVFQLVNKEKNKKLLENIPHREFLDLAIIYRILIIVGSGENQERMGTIVNYPIMEQMNLTEKQLYKIAKYRTKKILPIKLVGTGSYLFSLTNSKFFLGATSILYKATVAALAEKLEDDLIIMPSSLHEVMIVPASYTTLSQAQALVKDINRRGIEPEEWLSDNVYKYYRQTGAFEVTEEADESITPVQILN